MKPAGTEGTTLLPSIHSTLQRAGGSGKDEGDGGQTLVLRVQMEKSSAARAETDGLLSFLLEREHTRAGIDLSSLPISLKFQINKIHFSAPLPSPATADKRKAISRSLLQTPLPFSPFSPLSHLRGSLTSVSCSGRPPALSWGRDPKGGTQGSVVPPSQKYPSAENTGCCLSKHAPAPCTVAFLDTSSISPCRGESWGISSHRRGAPCRPRVFKCNTLSASF